MFASEYQNMVFTHDRPIMINVFISQDFSPKGWNWPQSNSPTLYFYQLEEKNLRDEICYQPSNWLGTHNHY